MTTVAKRQAFARLGTGVSVFSDESGQSLVEFLVMLPMLFGFVVILLRVNTAIQMSIVDQQYARAQALFLAFNSPIYPNVRLAQTQLVSKGYNQMVIGVSDNPAPAAGSGPYLPLASTENIARRGPAGSDENRAEPPDRTKIRVRNTVTLCTPSFLINAGGKMVAALPLGGGPAYSATGPSNLNEGTTPQFCGSPMAYEQ